MPTENYTKEEIHEWGYEMFCDASDLPRGLSESASNLTPRTKKIFYAIIFPYLFGYAVWVFIQSFFRHGLDAIEMTKVFIKFQTKYMEERGWIEKN